MRGYADHVTHELKSLLTVVRDAAELLALPDLPAAERERLIGKVEVAADRMTALLDAQRSLAHAQEPASRGQVRLSDVAQDVEVVQDDIVPLSEEALRLVLDHFTTRREAGGTGMGLSIVRRIPDAHDANIALEPSEAGARFVIRFQGFMPFLVRKEGRFWRPVPLPRRGRQRGRYQPLP